MKRLPQLGTRNRTLAEQGGTERKLAYRPEDVSLSPVRRALLDLTYLCKSELCGGGVG